MISPKEQETCSNLELVEKFRKELLGPLSRPGWEHQRDFLNYILIFLFWRFASEELCRYVNKNQRKHYAKKRIKEEFDYEYETFSEEELRNLKNSLKGVGFYYFLSPDQLSINVWKNLYKGREGLSNKVEEILKEYIWRSQCSEYVNRSVSDTIYRSFRNRIEKDIDLTTSNSPLGNNPTLRDEWVEKFIQLIQNLELDSPSSFGDFSLSLIRKYFLFACTRPHSIQENISRLCIELFKQFFPDKKKLNVYDIACNGGNFLIQLKKEWEFKMSVGFERDKENIVCTLINFWMNNFSPSSFRLENPLRENQDWEERFDLFLVNDSYPNKQGILDFQKERFDRNHPKFEGCTPTRPCWAHTFHSLYKLSLEGVCFLMATCDDLGPTNRENEKELRMHFLGRGYIEAIIMLPRRADRLRQGSNQGRNIVWPHLLIFRRNRPREASILFINATREKLDEQGYLNLERILEVYRAKKELKGFSHLVSFENIRKKGCSLTWETFFEFVPENEEDILLDAAEIKTSGENHSNISWTDEERRLYEYALPKSESKRDISLTETSVTPENRDNQPEKHKFLTKKQLKDYQQEHISSDIKESTPAQKQTDEAFSKEKIDTIVKPQDSVEIFQDYRSSTLSPDITKSETDNLAAKDFYNQAQQLEKIEKECLEKPERAAFKVVKEKKKKRGFFSWFRGN